MDKKVGFFTKEKWQLFISVLGYMILSQLIQPTINFEHFSDWKGALIALYEECFGFLISYGICQIAIKEKYKDFRAICIIVLSIILSWTLDFQFVFEFTTVNVILLSVAVIGFISLLLFFRCGKAVSDKIKGIENLHIAMLLYCLYFLWLILSILAFLASAVILMILYFRNGRF